MAGVGRRRDEVGQLKTSSSNVFAALDSLRKKKKKPIDHSNAKARAEEQVVWAPVPLKVKSWADVDDDDDYFATAPPPPPAWGVVDEREGSDSKARDEANEIDSEDDVLEYGDENEDEDEEPEQEHEVPAQVESSMKKAPPLVVPKEPEKQLSKKELKKKELAELEAVLAELGISNMEEKSDQQQNGTTERTESIPGANSESKTSKKKKKKASKEAKDLQEHSDITNGQLPVVTSGSEKGEGDTDGVDIKERLKKVTSIKKKKSSKEIDAAAKAAAMEAAARSAKLMAAKKKEKNHYNQQPVR